jgi:hypothetical protein
MALTPEEQAAIATGTKTAAEIALPVLLPFDPLITLVMVAIMAHFNATRTWPTAAEVQAALPADYQALVAGWAAWKPSGDGSMK